MRIYYGASKGHSDPQIEKIALDTIPHILKELGHTIDCYAYNPVEIKQSRSFREISEHIQESDIFIGEMSRPSQTLGFKIAYALNIGKPCLYIYNKSRQGEPDLFISRHPSRLLKISSYRNNNDLISELKTFLKSATTQMRSTRTSFLSTRRIDQYVDTTAKKLGLSKGEVIRQLLDDAINTNKLNIK